MGVVGLHLRLRGTLVDVAHVAAKFHMPFFQCFLTLPASGTVVSVDQATKAEFVALRRKHFSHLFLHGSYLSNLASIRYDRHPVLKKELTLAKELEFTHVILHPGSAKGALTKSEGIDALARSVDIVLAEERDITIVLENTAHGKLSMGGDLNDFLLLRQRIDEPERLFFCIDTAHAYSFGYDIADKEAQNAFVDLIEETMGFDQVVLIHLNDTHKRLGSKIDQHGLLGEGNIGWQALEQFVTQPALDGIPLIIEPPIMPDDELFEIYRTVVEWHDTVFKEVE